MSASINEKLRNRILIQAGNRCGYCLTRQEYVPWPLEIEHIVPLSRGGTNDEDNLWLSCRSCNAFKGIQTHARDPLSGRRIRLFDPRRQQWARHFYWGEDGTLIIGHTACGRATVVALKLNNLVAVTVRSNWVEVGWHPPP